MHPRHRLLILAALLFALPSLADVSWLPASHHHQYLTHGLFIDEQTTLVARDGGRAWGGFGGSFALAEAELLGTRPQLVLSGNIDTSFRVLNGPLDLRAETFDVRLAATVDVPLAPNLRAFVGFLHLSGHAADGLFDTTLFPAAGGSDQLFARLVFDGGDRFRIGLSARPVLRSSPGASFLDANQFAEWFPFGARDSATQATPYVAVGLEEYGTDGVELTWHVQGGVYWGNHLRADHAPMVRFVVGYYDGADPRIKISRLAGGRAHFPYLGFMLHI